MQQEPMENNELPQAVIHPPHRSPLPLVWIVPIVAALVGAWIGINALLARGPSITIEFRTAEGLEAGKTRIRYRSVDIGVVRSIELAADHNGVRVHADMDKGSAALLVGDSRFWIVRPRIAAGGVSGLSTLLSGSYIGMDIGKATETARDFVGLEQPPAVDSGEPGREYVLQGTTLGSLEVGSPLYFRQLPVGRVTRFALDPDGHGITLAVFVAAPFDRFVTRDTRFWHASGIGVSLSAEGVRIRTESLATILTGGIAFETPTDAEGETPAPAQARFRLVSSRERAMAAPDVDGHRFILYFEGSLRGLEAGAPVDLNGVQVGEVHKVNIEYVPALGRFRYPVEVVVYQDRIMARYREGSTLPRVESRDVYGFVEGLVEHGLRAQLNTGSLLTGQQVVSLRFFPKSKPVHSDPRHEPMEIPTVPGGLDKLEDTLTDIATRIDALPLESIGRDAAGALVNLRAALRSVTVLVDHLDAEVTPELAGTLRDARRALAEADGVLSADAPLQRSTQDALVQLGAAARSLHDLADYLERHPESLLRGKPKDPPP
jgi:paraquat-inducible protein B